MKKATILFDLKEEANTHKADNWPIFLQGTNKIFDRGYQISLSNKLSQLKLNFQSKSDEAHADIDQKISEPVVTKMDQQYSVTVENDLIQVKELQEKLEINFDVLYP